MGSPTLQPVHGQDGKDTGKGGWMGELDEKSEKRVVMG